MTNTYLEALDALVDSRPMLDPGNYGPGPYFRADQRANMRDRADYWLLRRLTGAPTGEAIEYAAKGSRIEFRQRDGGLTAYYTAGQYYPREYRAACARLLASVWWRAQAARYTDTPADTIREHARHVFGRGIASRWFN